MGIILDIRTLCITSEPWPAVKCLGEVMGPVGDGSFGMRLCPSLRRLTAQRKPRQVSVVVGPLFRFTAKTPAFAPFAFVAPSPPRRTAYQLLGISISRKPLGTIAKIRTPAKQVSPGLEKGCLGRIAENPQKEFSSARRDCSRV